MPEWTKPLLVGVGVGALLATTLGMVVQAQRADEAGERARQLEGRVDALRAEVGHLEAEVGRLEEELEDEPGDDTAGAGGQSGDPFGGLAEGLLSGAVPGAACMDAGGLLDGGLAEGGLDDLLSGGGEARPAEPEELVAVVAEHVADLRELDWQRDVAVDFIDHDELRDRLEGLLEDEPDLTGEQRLLAALGAVPAGLDLDALQRDLLDGQVAGYYAPEEGELVVRVPDDGTIRPLDEVTLAHELQHALADQTLGLPDPDEDTDDADAALASLAVIEGDATLLMQQWSTRHLSLTDQLTGLLTGDLAGAQAQLAAVPHHLQQELLFPYTVGLDYVCDLWRQGGWDAVDGAYATPPDTSLEVMDPGLDLAPAPPTPLAAPPGGEELLATTLGAAHLQWLFEAPGGETARALDDPRGRASAWGGDEVRVWGLDEERTVLGLSLVDRGGDGRLCASLDAWHAAAFPEQQRTSLADTTVARGPGPEGDTVGTLRCRADEVHYVSAPDLDTALNVLDG